MVNKPPPRDKPFFMGGLISFDGHECAPYGLTDAHRIVPGTLWVNGRHAEAAKEMLMAAYEAGKAAAKREGE